VFLARAGQDFEASLESLGGPLIWSIRHVASGDLVWSGNLVRTGRPERALDSYRATLARDGDYEVDIRLPPEHARPTVQVTFVLQTSIWNPPAATKTIPPEPPVVEFGECPSQCCTQPPWNQKGPIPVRVDMGADAKVFFELPAGEPVQIVKTAAVTNHVGRTRVLRDLELLARPGRWVGVGDELFIIRYEGERSAKVWIDGQSYSAELALSSPAHRHMELDVLERPVTQWWAYVRSDSGRAGWVPVPPLGESDACGERYTARDGGPAYRHQEMIRQRHRRDHQRAAAHR